MFFGCFKKIEEQPSTKSVKREFFKSNSFNQVCPEPPPQEIKSILKPPSKSFRINENIVIPNNTENDTVTNKFNRAINQIKTWEPGMIFPKKIRQRGGEGKITKNFIRKIV